MQEITHREVEETSSRGRHFWIRAFSLTLIVVVAMIVLFGAFGVYRGLSDRRLQSKQAAIDHFDQGNELVEQGNYELALAHFREAYRLEPNFEAAAYMIATTEQRLSEQGVNPQGEGIAGATVTSDSVATRSNNLSNRRAVESLFAEAVTALEKGDWEIAAATFDTLSSQAPNYRTEEVATGLFKARLEAGKAALEEESLNAALRHFDHALAIRPDDEETVRLRHIISAYRFGVRAYQAEEWGVAADQLRVVYVADPDFLEVEELLAQTHLELGQAFAAREIWCDAAQQYRSSLSIITDNGVSSLAEDAAARCNARVALPPATESASSLDEEEDDVVSTSVMTSTVGDDDDPANGGAGNPNAPASPTRVATSTVTTAQQPSEFTFALARDVSINNECAGNYIVGTVRARDGAPLSGVTILASDEWGNRLMGTSKTEPLGQYDIPISGQPASYQVVVVAGEQVLSAPATVWREEGGQDICFTLDWQQIN